MGKAVSTYRFSKANMNLLDFARQNGLTSCKGNVRKWTGDLNGSSEGHAVRRNLVLEKRLHKETAGQSALRALVLEIGRWNPAAGGALAWLRQLLGSSSGTFLCKGAAVPNTTDTEALCRLTSIDAVYHHLVDDRVTGTVAVLAVTTSSPTREDELRTWAKFAFESKVGPYDAIDPNKTVRGMLPVVFGAPKTDVTAYTRHGARAGRLLQLIGKSRDPVDWSDQCLLVFNRTDVPQCCVPSALDAFDNKYFLPPCRNASWGSTWDLKTNGGTVVAGVRECTLMPFPARAIVEISVVEV